MFRYYGLSMKDYQEYVRTKQEKRERRLNLYKVVAPRVGKNYSSCALGTRGKPTAASAEQS